jgi:hypothetical protein
MIILYSFNKYGDVWSKKLYSTTQKKEKVFKLDRSSEECSKWAYAFLMTDEEYEELDNEMESWDSIPDWEKRVVPVSWGKNYT